MAAPPSPPSHTPPPFPGLQLVAECAESWLSAGASLPPSSPSPPLLLSATTKALSPGRGGLRCHCVTARDGCAWQGGGGGRFCRCRRNAALPPWPTGRRIFSFGRRTPIGAARPLPAHSCPPLPLPLPPSPPTCVFFSLARPHLGGGDVPSMAAATTPRCAAEVGWHARSSHSAGRGASLGDWERWRGSRHAAPPPPGLRPWRRRAAAGAHPLLALRRAGRPSLPTQESLPSLHGRWLKGAHPRGWGTVPPRRPAAAPHSSTHNSAPPPPSPSLDFPGRARRLCSSTGRRPPLAVYSRLGRVPPPARPPSSHPPRRRRPPPAWRCGLPLAGCSPPPP